jgi:hypothetical protein
MFSVECPRHGGRVLLFPDNIEMLVNTVSAIEIHWRCTCGEAGVQILARSGGRQPASPAGNVRASTVRQAV